MVYRASGLEQARQIEEQKRKQDLDKSAILPSSPAYIKTPAITDSIAKADSVSQIPSITSLPRLDPPKRLDSDNSNLGRSAVKTALTTKTQTDTPIENLNIYDMVMRALSDMDDLKSFRLEIMSDRTKRQLEDFKAAEIAREEQIQKQLTATKHVSIADMVQDSLKTIGIILFAATTAATGGSSAVVGGLVAAAVCQCVLTLDQFFEDKAKLAIGTWMTRGDHEQAVAYSNRIKSFVAFVSWGLAIGFTGTKAIDIAMKISQGATGGIRTLLDRRQQVLKSEMMSGELKSTLSQKEIDRLMHLYELLLDDIDDNEINIQQIEKNNERLQRIIARQSNT